MGIFGWLLGLRYRVRAEGLAEVRKLRTPILFLFEHPAQIDAFLHATVLAKALGKQKIPRYLAARDFTVLPFVSACFGDFLLPVPEDTPRRRRVILLDLLMADAIETLRGGRHLALSPVGALIRGDGKTNVGSKTGTAQILRAFSPGQVTVVTTRIEGLYGASTSRALTGEAPDPRYLLAAIRAFAKGGGIASHRREVKMRFEVHPDFPIGESATVAAVNGRLSEIFRDQREPVFTPYNRFDGKALPELPRPAASGASEPFFERVLRKHRRRFVRAWAKRLAGFSEERMGVLLPEGPVRAAAEQALLLAGKLPVPVDPLAPDKSVARVLTCEAYLDALAARRVVFERWERDRVFLDLAAITGLDVFFSFRPSLFGRLGAHA